MLLGFATLMAGVAESERNASLVHIVAWMKLFGKGLFTFLTILIGYKAQKAFGGSGVNGAIIAALFILGYDPEATSGYFSGTDNFFGLGIDPRGNIIGLVAWRGLPVGLDSVFGPSGLVALPLMTSAQGIYAGMAVYAAGVGISWIAGFVVTWFFGHKQVDLS